MAVTLAANLYTVAIVKVGGPLYTEIRERKDALQALALLQADLNQVRAELAVIAGEADLEQLRPLEAHLKQTRGVVVERFAALEALLWDDGDRTAFADARVTWEEFGAAIDDVMLPAVEQGRIAAARSLLVGPQRKRYERFIDQVGALVDKFTLEIVEREGATAARVRTTTVAAASACAVLFLLILLAQALFARSLARRVEALKRTAEQVATGDLTPSAVDTSRDELGQLARALSGTVDMLREVAERVKASAANLASASQSMSAAATQVSQGAAEQASSATEASESVDRVGEIIGQNAEHE